MGVLGVWAFSYEPGTPVGVGAGLAGKLTAPHSRKWLWDHI